MGAIAAVVVPAGGRPVNEMGARLEAALAAGWHSEDPVRTSIHVGRSASAALIQLGAQPFMAAPQGPITEGGVTAVQAGYYLPAQGGVAAGAPGGLARDLAGGDHEAVARGDGVFAYAAWDARRERLLAGVDKLGLRPLYHVEFADGCYAVASEVRALLPLLGRVRPNWAGWEDVLRLGYLLGSHTLVEGVRRFGLGEVHTWSGSRLQRSGTEHFLASIEPKPLSRTAFVAENEAVFDAAMRRLAAVTGDSPPLLTLSAGLDSRRILAAMLAHGTRPTVINVPLPGRDGMEREGIIARQVAAAAGLDLLSVLPPVERLACLEEFRDILSDFETSEHLVYSVVAAAFRMPDRVNYDGMGGDTLFNPARFLRRRYLGAEGERLFLQEMEGVSDWFVMPDVEPFRERLAAVWEPFRSLPNRYTLFALETRARRALALGPLGLQGRAFESVFPFLDRHVMASALAYPPEEKLADPLQADFVRSIGPASLAELPSTRDAAGQGGEAWSQQFPEWGGHARDCRIVRSALFSRPGTIRPAVLERVKGAVVAVAAPLLSPERVRWSASKASKIRRIRRWESLVASPAAYMAAAESAAVFLGANAEWIRPVRGD